MAYGSVREITSCMMMEKLKMSPANEPPLIGFLKSSGAVHSNSERTDGSADRQAVRQTGGLAGRHLVELHTMFLGQEHLSLFHLVDLLAAGGSESEGSWGGRNQ